MACDSLTPGGPCMTITPTILTIGTVLGALLGFSFFTEG